MCLSGCPLPSAKVPYDVTWLVLTPLKEPVGDSSFTGITFLLIWSGKSLAGVVG